MVSDTENTYKIQTQGSGNDSDLRMNHLCSSGQVSFDYYHAVLTAASMQCLFESLNPSARCIFRPRSFSMSLQ